MFELTFNLSANQHVHIMFRLQSFPHTVLEVLLAVVMDQTLALHLRPFFFHDVCSIHTAFDWFLQIFVCIKPPPNNITNELKPQVLHLHHPPIIPQPTENTWTITKLKDRNNQGIRDQPRKFPKRLQRRRTLVGCHQSEENLAWISFLGSI